MSTDPAARSTPDDRSRTLTADEIAGLLAGLPGWTVVTSAGADGRDRRELYRSFRFASFADAIAFMQAAAPHIDQVDHHPRWENVHRTVRVWLSTWDAGHVPTRLDVALAGYLNGLFEERGAPKA